MISEQNRIWHIDVSYLNIGGTFLPCRSARLQSVSYRLGLPCYIPPRLPSAVQFTDRVAEEAVCALADGGGDCQHVKSSVPCCTSD
jgi:hypothetical protein